LPKIKSESEFVSVKLFNPSSSWIERMTTAEFEAIRADLTKHQSGGRSNTPAIFNIRGKDVQLVAISVFGDAPKNEGPDLDRVSHESQNETINAMAAYLDMHWDTVAPVATFKGE